MKKVFLGAATLALLSTSAYATKARLLALGDEVEDNYYTMDDRYIFTNASFVNNYGDMVVLEYGAEGIGSGSATLDTDGDPKAMGGFFKKMGNFTYGLYLGNESNISTSLRILASAPAAGTNYLASSDNQLELFIGGKAGVNWGAAFVYASSDRDVTSIDGTTNNKMEDEAMAVKLGVNKDNWDAYANVSLMSESKNLLSGNKFDGTLGVQVGGSYTINKDTKFYGSYKTFSWDQERGFGAEDGELSRLDLGAGKEYKVEGGMVFVRTAFQVINVELNAVPGKAKLETMNLPVIIGAETKATDWLTLRGSVSQSVYSNAKSTDLANATGGPTNILASAVVANYNGSYTNGDASFENTTRVAVGATLTYKTVDIDVYTGTNGEDTDSRVAMKYNF
ncbi:hypothetical protein [Halobacteriovorax sp. DA5]|uniref:hypothetical protein n=1 Tax=Halobacteriovorax sp. DA5 TaxID=2067553 RepID=UPI000CD16DD6|nr:hypothetical protein [Halobacteriovorax sp. DA5]POB12899.1 hypothetical protein C0Z22_13560 [Halobacteriovorax sp. DA5]